MKNLSRRRKQIIGIVAFLVLGTAADLLFVTQTETGRQMLADMGLSFTRSDDGGYVVSGLIETVDVTVGAELGGRVLEVSVREGDTVPAGAVLARLDATALERQLEQARGVLMTAQANYDLLAAGATEDELALAQANVTAAQHQLVLAQQAYDDVFQHAELARAQTQASVASAQDRLDHAERSLRGVVSPDIQWYQDQLADAQDALTIARDNQELLGINEVIGVYDQARKNRDDFKDILTQVRDQIDNCVRDTNGDGVEDHDCSPDRAITVDGVPWTLEDAQDAYDDAEHAFRQADLQLQQAQITAQNTVDDAVKALEDATDDLTWALADPNAIDLAVAQANVAVAQAALDDALAQWTDVQDGPDPDVVDVAETQLAVAQANLEAAQAQLEITETGPRVEQLTAARGQVEAAQAAVDLLEWQLTQQTITATSDGVVLTRLVEPGEIAPPGAPLFVLGDLENLTLTVFVPENIYGAITLGQTATITADSFPDETFTATVQRIADQAEFTPRNVQTAEERVKTVFAIELAIKDVSGRLKPGMPADARFGA